MGEDRTEPYRVDRAATEPTEHPTGRATVGEAAELLGITAEAVRSRVKRGTLKSVKEGSTVYVLLEGAGYKSTQTTARTAPEHDRTDDRAALVDSLEDQIRYLREQLGEERESRRRADTLLAQLTQANASMAHQIRELMVPRDEPQAPETVPGTSEGASPRSDTVGAQEGAQEPEETARRPWWVRWFGG